ncbi:hypothetical protein GEZ68_027715, partial [Pseudomonas aeruginosa]
MSAVFDASAFLANCSNRPGVYRMFVADAKLLYVGNSKSPHSIRSPIARARSP